MKDRLTSLPLQLLGFLIVPLVAILLFVALFSVNLHQQAMRQMLESHNQQTVPAIGDALSSELKQRQSLLQQAVDSPTVEPLDAAVVGLFDSGVVAYDLSGELLWATTDDVSEMVTWQHLSNVQQPDVSPLMTPDAERFHIMISVRGQNAVIGGITSFDNLATYEAITGLETSRHTVVYLTDTNERVLYQSNSSMVGESINISDDDETIVTSALIPEAGWQLIQEERWEEELTPILRYSQIAPLVLVPGLLLAVVVVWFGLRRIVYPIRQLEAQATSLDWGNFAAIEDEPVDGIKEIQHLQATLWHMVRRLQIAQAGMHNFVGAITRAQEEERLRLARELHDQTAQSLVALNHRIQLLKPHLQDDPEATALIKELRTMVIDSVEDLRRIVRALRPAYLEELGLAPALEMLAQDLSQHNQMQVTYAKQGTPRRLSPEQEIVLYRIAQEALNNAWQHSQASRVNLTVAFEERLVTVTVEDNGIGFTAPRHAVDLTQTGPTHFGIMGMYERASLIGAHLQIHSEMGHGTTITVTVPLET